MDIKVEPLSPGVFSIQCSGGESSGRMRIPTKTDTSQRTESESAHYQQMEEFEAQHQQQHDDISYKYQSVSMPVFPNMPYSTAYPYVPIRPAPTQTSVASARYTQSNLTVSDPYEAEEEAAFEEKVPRNSTGIIGKRSHLPKRYKCAMCAYRTRYKSDLNRHVRKHAIATFNCDICNMPFKTVGNVEFHKRKEHSDLLVASQMSSAPKETAKYTCKMCPYGSQYSSDLTRHVRKHYVAKFHCTVCNKPFMTSGSLVNHKRAMHAADDGSGDFSKRNPVEENSESDFESADLNHVDVNGNDKEDMETDSAKRDSKHSGRDFSMGNEAYTDDSVMKNDESSLIMMSENSYCYEEPDMEPPPPLIEGVSVPATNLSAEKPSTSDSKYSCPYCEKTFGRKLVLEYHLKNVHRAVADEKGDFVEYNNDYDLALDMSIQELENHSPESHRSTTAANNGPLRHKCPFCAYGTNYKSTYDRHVRKHELLCHICNVCRMPFITFGHLQRHIRDNHPDHNQQISKKEVTIEKQTCSYCEYEAETLEQLRKHCEEQHGHIIAQEINRMGSRKSLNKQQTSPSVTETHGTAGSKANYSVEEISVSPHVEQPVFPGPSPKETPQQYQIPKEEPQMEEGVYTYPPSSGRYARLVSDFDNFAAKPFACALCFYRCADVDALVVHAENHLTGCNSLSVPETARFTIGAQSKSSDTASSHPKMQERKPPTMSDGGKSAFPTQVPIHTAYNFPSTSVHSSMSTFAHNQGITRNANNLSQIKREPSSNRRKSSMPTRLRQTPPSPTKTTKPAKESAMMGKFNLNIDRLIPTFSVHYRKDKTNPTKPYLCLLCRKRFRHLPLLKQHFRQVHNESSSVNNQKFECEACNLTFNTPMALQEHHEVHH